MLFKEYTYSVLIVSAADKFSDQLENMLPENEFWPVSRVKSISAARRKIIDKNYDLILINSPLSDEVGDEFAIDSVSGTGRTAVIFAKNDIYDQICEKMMGFGVMTLKKPIGASFFLQCLNLCYAVLERFKTAEEHNITIEEKMEEIRIINRAKNLLAERLGFFIKNTTLLLFL